jgi:hypothetical protein
MPAVTAPLAFPYPLPTEPLGGAANAIKLLAEKIDDYLTVTSQAATLGASMTGGSYATLWRQGRMVWLQYDITTTAAKAAGVTLLTVPANWRPVATSAQWQTSVLGAGVGTSLFQVNAGTGVGNLPLTALAINDRVFGTTSWMTT